jgi:hypothetical protein
MRTVRFFQAQTAVALAVAALSWAAPAPAQDELTDAERECITSCRESGRDCMFDAREAFKACLEEAGCSALSETFRATCLVADRDEDACSAARDALRECRAPCREADVSNRQACRDAFESCLSEECGIDELPPMGRPGRGGGHRPGGHRGR